MHRPHIQVYNEINYPLVKAPLPKNKADNPLSMNQLLPIFYFLLIFIGFSGIAFALEIAKGRRRGN
jgi:hypothetical protein